MSLRDQILETTLGLIARRGIAATSVQDIADACLCSKATVLYHFSHKELLVDEALRPGLAAVAQLVESTTERGLENAAAKLDFAQALVGVLLEQRLAIHTIITHPYLVDSIPALAQAQALMARLAELVSDQAEGDYEGIRFGIALAGVTYALVSTELLGLNTMAEEDLRTLLTSVLRDMVLPGAATPSGAI